ncbi:unnamed protein product [Vitrella brassicaformis CCMP3155]|uniref:Uncharacterized protein n=1 Tax=Vitrella brassicaformis (strain CCMP3155) TaxID=1169540 RepID=A0A0G4GVY1_VITBC|nr:unnamed protein product [Vitrella brassicaformis CCMP3155]|eukprot:CEM35091.1 unnamed protein product [Vitrella brassicaformis CCMP3155]
MSDRPVGHLYGRDVYAFGDGGYAFEAKGDLRPLRKEDCKAVSLFANYSPTEDTDGFIQLPSGVRYRIVQRGDGQAPTLNQTVRIDNLVWQGDGEGFNDRSRPRYREVDERIDDSMPEWRREALLSMKVGEVRRLIVPATVEDGRRRHELRLWAIVNER